jgi:hypothetical protein
VVQGISTQRPDWQDQRLGGASTRASVPNTADVHRGSAVGAPTTSDTDSTPLVGPGAGIGGGACSTLPQPV